MNSRTRGRALGLLCTIAVSTAACSRGGKDGSAGDSKPSASAAASTVHSAPAPPASAVSAPHGQSGTSPNDFLTRGAPSFVLGTAGDSRVNAAIAAQAALVRGLFFATAPVVADDSIDVAKGPSAWPRNPVVYGGPHVNKLLAKLAPSLPFELSATKLVLGDQVFEGEGYLLITVVPARAPDAKGPGYPEFLLYAGTGSPGVAEINAVSKGREAILVADAFGRLVDGHWKRDGAPELSPRARRIAWRTVEKTLDGSDGRNRATVKMRFPESLPAAADEEATIEACMRGVATVVRKLAIASPASATFYVYPDRASKESLTGDKGDGHAVVSSRALHVVHAADPSPGGGLETLVAHEGTHVLAYEAWGPAGTPLMGEGLAVWVSGRYAGVTLDAWKARLAKRTPIVELLGPTFRKIPESESYPQGGLLVEAAVKEVGLDKVRAHLLGATAATWEGACKAAGTSAKKLEELATK